MLSISLSNATAGPLSLQQNTTKQFTSVIHTCSLTLRQIPQKAHPLHAPSAPPSHDQAGLTAVVLNFKAACKRLAPYIVKHQMLHVYLCTLYELMNEISIT